MGDEMVTGRWAGQFGALGFCEKNIAETGGGSVEDWVSLTGSLVLSVGWMRGRPRREAGKNMPAPRSWS
jgi:hypothetical protein